MDNDDYDYDDDGDDGGVRESSDTAMFRDLGFEPEEDSIQAMMNDFTPNDGGFSWQPKLIGKNFKLEVDRIKSFKNWPRALTQKPKALADAGFFYLNVGDQVRCFSCNLSLRHWEKTDDPWTEHIKFRVDPCAYTKLCKGKNAHDRITIVDEEDECSPTATTSTINANDKKKKVRKSETKASPMSTIKDDDKKETKSETTSTTGVDFLCKVCLDSELQVAFMPCGHYVSCVKCSFGCKCCPVCRLDIVNVVKIYR